MHGFAFAVLAASLLLSGAGAAAAQQQRDVAERYDRCLALTREDPKGALDMARAWYEAGGGFPAQHCTALSLIGLGRYEEAAKRLETLAGAMMQAKPEMRAQALEQAGQSWLLASKPAQAKSAFDAALAIKKDDPELLIDRAQALAEAGQYWEAIDDLNRVLDGAPDRADALIYRASAYRAVDGLDLAAEDVERALKLVPDAVPGLLERGNIRRIKGDLAGARKDWLRVEKLAPGTPAAKAAKVNLAHLDDKAAPETPAKKKKN